MQDHLFVVVVVEYIVDYLHNYSVSAVADIVQVVVEWAFVNIDYNYYHCSYHCNYYNYLTVEVAEFVDRLGLIEAVEVVHNYCIADCLVVDCHNYYFDYL